MPDFRRYVRERLRAGDQPAEREIEIVEELAGQLESIYERERSHGRTHDEAMAEVAEEVPDWSSLGRRLATLAPPRHSRLLDDTRGSAASGLAQDIRHAVRVTMRSPALTAVVALTL